ncbi:hypothetical protein P7F60_11915 [Rhizobium sp. YJ-22]|uniref:hypothetical protein n=1 Tax=Rhizobium sp. YJ-22 TaxID=3037556 RepID=UPI002412BBCD|nr:hypothetical protein [Rhizobium sp. YJ-22]MDG3577100.1 hypothetical protein [Rhizobium sp. YJ-22]
MRLALALTAALLAAGSAAAQTQPQADGSGSSAGDVASMAQLLAAGYEIRAAVPNGSKIIVFMQKDQSAYACEFASLTKTRCGTIN